MNGIVVAVSLSPTHSMAKRNQASIRLIAGFGVEGDAHAGAKVKHRYLAKKNPDLPNLSQVHLIHVELLEELRNSGFQLVPGQMGDNITTQGVDILGLPMGTRLHIGGTAIVEVTGLRTPCKQLDGIQRGLMAATKEKLGKHIRLKAGIMSIVVESGEIRQGDTIHAEMPPMPHLPLRPV